MFPTTLRRAALILLVIISLSLNAYQLIGLIGAQAHPVDDVSKWENRLRGVKQKLPPGVEMIGYVADEDLRPVFAPTDGEWVEFYLTQYALSPVIVRRGAKQSWILGNFAPKNIERWLARSGEAYAVEDLGAGIYLIHRTRK